MYRFLRVSLVFLLAFGVVLACTISPVAAGREIPVSQRKASAALPLADGYWTSYHNAPGWAQVNSVSIQEDGNILAAGYTTPSAGGSADIWVRKYNTGDGSVMWTDTYDSGHGDDIAYGTVSRYGSTLVVGTAARSSTSSDAWMRYYNDDGSVIWTATYRAISPGWNTANACSVESTRGPFVVGECGTGGNRRAWVIQIKSGGGVDWAKVFPSGADSVAHGVSCDIDGNPVAVGVSGGRAWMRKYEAGFGSLIWNKTFSAGDYSQGSSISYGPDDNLTVCGVVTNGSDTDAWVRMIRSSNGSTVWTKSYGGSGYQGAWNVARDLLGNSVVVGQKNTSGGLPRAWVRKYTPQGDTAWTENYSGSPGVGAIPYGVSCDMDGNPVVGGARVFSSKNGAFVRKYPPSANANPEWFLAEGSTAWGFDTYISIENPNDSEVNADISYNTASGPVDGGAVTMPPMSRATVDPRTVLGDTDFSTRVACREGMTIAVDRTMSWTGTGAASPEAHSSVGVTMPGKRWYLPEGSTNWGFESYLLIQNPNAITAWCSIHYMFDDGTDYVIECTVDPYSRFTINCLDQIVNARDFSIDVASRVPIIPERAMYRNARREGHDSIGTRTAAGSYFLAEGTTAWGFTTYVLVANPQLEENQVTVTYMTPSGPRAQPPFVMPGNSRKTIRVNDVLPDTDFSTQVQGTQPLIAERAMYWTSATGEACHDSIGMDSAHTTFYLPDGQTSDGHETWTLVQNPNGAPVDIRVTYLSPDGTTNQTFIDSIPAQSRKTYNMAERMPSTKAAILVECLTADAKIMCERAMYYNARGAGTGTIGGYSD